MSDIVWASNAMINPAMLRALSHSFSGDSEIEFAIGCRRRNDAGESLGPECFPREVYVSHDSDRNYENLPELFFAGSYWVVSGEVADIMRRFDLGQGNLYPTKVFRKDRKTLIGDRWFCLNFGNVKRAYQGGGENQMPWVPEPPIRHSAPLILMDNRLTVSSEAFAGPDIWVDPQIRDIFFISDRLSKDLKVEGVARAFGLKKCRAI
jgi:hypothetical protein